MKYITLHIFKGSLKNGINTVIYIFLLTSSISMQICAEWQKYLIRKRQSETETSDHTGKILHKTGFISIFVVILFMLNIVLSNYTPDEFRNHTFYIVKVNCSLTLILSGKILNLNYRIVFFLDRLIILGKSHEIELQVINMHFFQIIEMHLFHMIKMCICKTVD
jgi:hypothetical protein